MTPSFTGGLSELSLATLLKASIFVLKPKLNHPTSSIQLLAHRHTLLDLCNRFCRVQALRTCPRTVQNSVTSVQTHVVVQRLLALRLTLIPTVGQPPVALQQDGWAEILFTVPPVAGARSAAAGAEDALVEAVELLAVGG